MASIHLPQTLDRDTVNDSSTTPATAALSDPSVSLLNSKIVIYINQIEEENSRDRNTHLSISDLEALNIVVSAFKEVLPNSAISVSLVNSVNSESSSVAKTIDVLNKNGIIFNNLAFKIEDENLITRFLSGPPVIKALITPLNSSHVDSETIFKKELLGEVSIGVTVDPNVHLLATPLFSNQVLVNQNIADKNLNLCKLSSHFKETTLDELISIIIANEVEHLDLLKAGLPAEREKWNGPQLSDMKDLLTTETLSDKILQRIIFTDVPELYFDTTTSVHEVCSDGASFRVGSANSVLMLNQALLTLTRSGDEFKIAPNDISTTYKQTLSLFYNSIQAAYTIKKELPKFNELVSGYIQKREKYGTILSKDQMLEREKVTAEYTAQILDGLSANEIQAISEVFQKVRAHFRRHIKEDITNNFSSLSVPMFI